MQHLKLSLQLATFLEREQCCFSSAPSPPWALALDNKKLTLDIKHEFGFLLPPAVLQFGSGPLVGPSAAGLGWAEPEPWLLWSQLLTCSITIIRGECVALTKCASQGLNTIQRGRLFPARPPTGS